MKKAFLIIYALLLGFLAMAQPRTYIIKPYDAVLDEDLYVVEQPGGSLEYHLGVYNFEHVEDSVHLVMTRRECELMYEALRKIRSKYNEWTIVARRNKVRNYTRRFDVEMPLMSYEWREAYTAYNSLAGRSGYKPVCRADSQRLPAPEFVVTDDGRCIIEFRTTLTKDDARYDLRFIIPADSRLCSFMKHCDIRWVDKQYEKLQPKSKEYYDSLFK